MVILLRKPHVLLLLLVLIPFPGLFADRVNLKAGNPIDGTIDSVQGTSVMIKTAQGNYPIPLDSIASVDMAAPPDLDKAGTAPDGATIVALLDPLVAKFKGLPTPWLELAMYRLGCGDIAISKLADAGTVSVDLVTIYPSSPTAKIYSDILKARVSLKSGSPSAAHSVLNPLLAQADALAIPPKDLQPAYAELFFAAGLVGEAEKKPEDALEQYLKIKVILYQDSAAQPVADKLIADLKKSNPFVSVK